MTVRPGLRWRTRRCGPPQGRSPWPVCHWEDGSPRRSFTSPRVVKLALLNTWARPQAPEFCQGWHQAIARVEQGQYEQVLQEYLPSLFHPSRLVDREFIETFLAMCRRVGPAAYLRQLKAMAALERHDSLPDLRLISCSTLVIHGRQDEVFSLAEHEAIAGAIPKAKLVVIDECGHESPLEQPQAVTTLLRDWLLND